MLGMDAINVAEWQRRYPHRFIAMLLTLPDRTLYLTSGGTVKFQATDHSGVTATRTFIPRDSEYGKFTSIGDIEEGEVNEAMSPDLGFATATDAGFAGLSAAQDSMFTLWYGLVHSQTGLVLGMPTHLWTASLNVSTPEFGPGARGLMFTTYTEAQKQLVLEGQKLDDDPVIARTMQDTTRKIFWRADQPYPAGRPRNVGGGGGGAGGGIDNALNRLV